MSAGRAPTIDSHPSRHADMSGRFFQTLLRGAPVLSPAACRLPPPAASFGDSADLLTGCSDHRGSFHNIGYHTRSLVAPSRPRVFSRHSGDCCSVPRLLGVAVHREEVSCGVTPLLRCCRRAPTPRLPTTVVHIHRPPTQVVHALLIPPVSVSVRSFAHCRGILCPGYPSAFVPCDLRCIGRALSLRHPNAPRILFRRAVDVLRPTASQTTST